jgi:hypothetical protein
MVSVLKGLTPEVDNIEKQMGDTSKEIEIPIKNAKEILQFKNNMT